MLPKLIITDIDGVWTDGGMYYDNQGNELKKFNTSDSAGVLLCRELGIHVAIITGENTEIVKNRAKKLSIDLLFQGVKDKVTCAEEIWRVTGVNATETAFIGDDFGDVPLLKKVAFAGCPANAAAYIKKHAHWIGNKSGGDGAFREFVEHILSVEGRLESTVDQIINKLHATK
jgi:3-deoxy-D-manno-octulosonate 8-phosphate phosphatase (KDO 8-P phosphatase)